MMYLFFIHSILANRNKLRLISKESILEHKKYYGKKEISQLLELHQVEWNYKTFQLGMNGIAVIRKN